MSSILTNNSAMVALQTLRGINSNLETVQSEISTGKKVATAKDNAAIWAISTVMSTDVDSFNQITDSLNKGSSTVGVARAAAEQVTGLLQDMKNLIVSAQEDLNADDRAKIQTDIDAKRTAISNIVNAAQFNGQNLLKGTESISILASLDRGS
ncbi:MAG: flagellin, partial [Hyphomonas sp.]|nr:flagellin [Hyphomonas sp.]